MLYVQSYTPWDVFAFLRYLYYTLMCGPILKTKPESWLNDTRTHDLNFTLILRNAKLPENATGIRIILLVLLTLLFILDQGVRVYLGGGEKNYRGNGVTLIIHALIVTPTVAHTVFRKKTEQRHNVIPVAWGAAQGDTVPHIHLYSEGECKQRSIVTFRQCTARLQATRNNSRDLL